MANLIQSWWTSEDQIKICQQPDYWPIKLLKETVPGNTRVHSGFKQLLREFMTLDTQWWVMLHFNGTTFPWFTTGFPVTLCTWFVWEIKTKPVLCFGLTLLLNLLCASHIHDSLFIITRKSKKKKSPYWRHIIFPQLLPALCLIFGNCF